MNRVPTTPVTVVETPEFLRAVRGLLDDTERMALIDYRARNPTTGCIVRGTGGVRKLRWAIGSRGKRGGARVIYFFHNGETPLFLLTVFAKSERVDLTQADRNLYRRLTAELVDAFSESSE